MYGFNKKRENKQVPLEPEEIQELLEQGLVSGIMEETKELTPEQEKELLEMIKKLH